MRSLTSLPLLTAIGLFSLCLPPGVVAQKPVTAISAGYLTQSSTINLYKAQPVGSGAFGGCSSTSYTYTFSNGSANQYKLNSFNAGGSTYIVAPGSAGQVKLRRVDNANAAGNKNIIYMETTAASAVACPSGSTLAFKPPYVDSMESLLGAGMLNQGTDNVFTNAGNGDGNNNNIERMDVIFSSRLNTISPTEAGFAIFDRGPNYGHDPFKIVAITSLDAQGNPNGFGTVLTCVGGNGSNSNGYYGHPTTANGNKTFAAYVLRKDASDPKLRVSSDVNQDIGGVFYTFADLGIGAGQPLYGYALLGPDGIANPTTAQLLSLTNSSVYPTNTTEASGGGLDLVAVNTVFATGSYVVLPVMITSFSGSLQNEHANLQWQIANYSGDERVTLQRSTDGSGYQTVATQIPAAAGSYQDATPPSAGILYYRLEVTTAAGATTYSAVLMLHPNAAAAPASWKVFPTIVGNGQTLHLQGLADGSYDVSLYGVAGSCYKMTTHVLGGEAQFELPQNGLSTGIYWINLSAGGKPLTGNGKIFVR